MNLEPTDRHSPCTFSADETPTDVDMLVVLDPPARGEVVGEQDAVIGEHDAARRKTVGAGVVGHGTTHTAHQAACDTQTHTCLFL